MRPASIDVFEHVSIAPADDGRYVRAARVICGECSSRVDVAIGTMKNTAGDNSELEHQRVRRRLEGEGWIVGRKTSAHRCPTCAKPHHQSLQAHREETPVVEKKPSLVPMPPPVPEIRQMTRDDRRIVFQKLDETYVSSKVGYSPGWSDERVSIDLGVPRAWVKLIREENFGDELVSDQIREKVVEARDALEKARKEYAAWQASVAICDKLEKELAEIARFLK